MNHICVIFNPFITHYATYSVVQPIFYFWPFVTLGVPYSFIDAENLRQTTLHRTVSTETCRWVPLEPCSFIKVCGFTGLLIPKPGETCNVPFFNLSKNSRRFFHTSGKRSSGCSYSIWRKILTVFSVQVASAHMVVLFHLAENSHWFFHTNGMRWS